MKRVHFVCVGNCCRSQMAEGFARHFGRARITASSSGLAPTSKVAWETIAIMRKHGVDISTNYPKKFDPYGTGEFDLIVNISGFDLPGNPVPPVQNWIVRDPFGESAAVYDKCAADIRTRVAALIDRFKVLSGPTIAPNGIEAKQ